MKKLAMLLFVVACVLNVADAYASTCTLTNFPASGVLTADRLNQRLRQTETCINGNIGNVNMASSEPLAVTLLQNQYALYSQSFAILDEDGDATAGEDIGATTDARKWQVPVTSTVTGMSVTLFCSASACAAASATVTLQKDTTTIKSFTTLADENVHTDFALSSSVTNAQVLNIDIAGTLTDVERIEVVVYMKAQHQT